MKIEIVNKKGTLIVGFDLESNPFKVGETINIKVENYKKDFWTVKEIYKEYRIDKLEHYMRKSYQFNETVSVSFVVSVEVTEIKNK